MLRQTGFPLPLLAALCLTLTALTSSATSSSLFVPQYSFDANDGFNDPQLGPARRAALEYALNLWSTWVIPQYPGQTINVAVAFTALMNGTLAEGGPADIYRVGPELNRVTPLANNFYRRDTNPNQPEIYVDFDRQSPFYLGVDGQTATNQYDFVTTALHEIGHGLGILDLIDRQTGGYYRNDGPGIYESFLAQTAGVFTPITSLSDADRLAALSSNDLWWTGPAVRAANGGQPLRIHAPPIATDGSGVSHLPPDSGSLWSPSLGRGEAIHSLNALDRALFQDLGYTVAEKPPAILFRPTCSTNGFCFSFQTTPGVLYVIEYKENFATTNWTTLSDLPITGDGTLQTFRDPDGRDRHRFYRVQSR